jgi:hypothetical protein
LISDNLRFADKILSKEVKVLLRVGTVKLILSHYFFLGLSYPIDRIMFVLNKIIEEKLCKEFKIYFAAKEHRLYRTHLITTYSP